MFAIESWIVSIVFFINLIFLLVMSFVSPYFKAIMSLGLGKIFNICWMVVVIIVAGVLFTFNAQCIVGTTDCKTLAWIITSIIVILTIANIGFGVYNTVKYTPIVNEVTNQEH